MNLLFFIIERNDGGVVDINNETPYLISNDCEAAQDAVDKLPNVVGGYRISTCEIDRDLAVVDVYFTTER